jgi:hypothetical protein
MRRQLLPGSSPARVACAWGLIALLGGALAGCSSQSATGGQQPSSLPDLRQKISLIEADSCYTANPRTVYRNCGARYLTEVNNAALVAQGVTANTAGAGTAGSAIDTIRNKIDDFNRRSCASAPPDLADTCAADLQAINAAFARLGSALPASTPTG